jgi:hypothetical protein
MKLIYAHLDFCYTLATSIMQGPWPMISPPFW